jgi:dipeptidyl aminopeptidase/acylaminoacyl peptidase
MTNGASEAGLTIDQLLAIRSQVGAEPPLWSADGSQLAASSRAHGGAEGVAPSASQLAASSRAHGGAEGMAPSASQLAASSRAHGGAEGVAPSASHIIFTSGFAGESNLWSIGVDGGFPQRLTTNLGSVRFLATRELRISPDGRWIAYLSEKNEVSEVWLWPTGGGAVRQLADSGANINALSWSPDSRSLAFSANRCGSFDIYRVEIAGGRTTRLTHDRRYEVHPVFTPDGQHIVYVRLDERWADHEVVMIPALGGEERVILRDHDFFDYNVGRSFGYPLVSPDGRTLLFRSYRSGWLNYWRVPIAGGEPAPLCAEAADQSDAAWSPDGRHVAYCVNHNGRVALQVVSAGGGAARPLVTPALGCCSDPQWSPDGSRIAYLAQTPTAPLDLWVVSVNDGAARQLTNSALVGSAGRLIVPEKITYRSADGLPISAYLYKPPGSGPHARSTGVSAAGGTPAKDAGRVEPPAIKGGDKFPAIIWIHGGPSSQWLDNFYGYMQYFSSQGFAVLAPNVRGSTGYGRAFEDLNNQDFGYGDLQDVLAGAAYLRTLDYINPDKLGITGTSYGGYLTASAVCFAPGIFQAAVAASGYPDRVAMYYEQELRHIKQMEFKFGPFETHQHIYRKCSPLYWARQATTPAFVLHGEGEPPRSAASRAFATALEKEYKTVQCKAYSPEGYYVQSLRNTRQMWLDMLEFFDRFLKEDV